MLYFMLRKGGRWRATVAHAVGARPPKRLFGLLVHPNRHWRYRIVLAPFNCLLLSFFITFHRIFIRGAALQGPPPLPSSRHVWCPNLPWLSIPTLGHLKPPFTAHSRLLRDISFVYVGTVSMSSSS